MDHLKNEDDFISILNCDKKAHAFVNGMARLAQDLDILAVAEHVENEEIWMQVMVIGIDQVQGDHIGRPDRGLRHTDDTYKCLATQAC